jgi:nucleoside-diphosphate-sugar epimerase
MNKNTKIFVAGHTGMVGSAILRRLRACDYGNPTEVDLLLGDPSKGEIVKSLTNPKYR